MINLLKYFIITVVWLFGEISSKSKKKFTTVYPTKEWIILTIKWWFINVKMMKSFLIAQKTFVIQSSADSATVWS